MGKKFCFMFTQFQNIRIRSTNSFREAFSVSSKRNTTQRKSTVWIISVVNSKLNFRTNELIEWIIQVDVDLTHVSNS